MDLYIELTYNHDSFVEGLVFQSNLSHSAAE